MTAAPFFCAIAGRVLCGGQRQTVTLLLLFFFDLEALDGTTAGGRKSQVIF
jgi:hypothetical protein